MRVVKKLSDAKVNVLLTVSYFSHLNTAVNIRKLDTFTYQSFGM